LMARRVQVSSVIPICVYCVSFFQW
jgi:hypothetical protein